MVNPIVNVVVNIIAAPAPDRLQRTGAIISQGGTTLEPGESALITLPSDFTEIATGTNAITSLAWSGGTVTATTTAPHGIPVSDVVPVIISGAAPTAYNGTFNATATGASTFTYPLVNNPGAAGTPGAWTPEDARELLAAITTYFSQGATNAVYILELGEGDAATGVVALNTYINAQPTQPFYRYLVPRNWADETTFLTFGAQFAANNKKTYFHVSATPANYTNFTSLMKWAIVYIDAPGIPATELGAAWPFYALLNYKPAPTNKVTPLAFAYGFGVTPYPVAGNNTLFVAFKAAHVNWAGTGAEAQLSNVILFYGTTMDGRDGSFWYGVDWVQINIDISVSAAVIQGSNDPINPLYYDQPGIDRLQQVGFRTLGQAVSYGMLNGTVKATALDSVTFDNNINSGAYAGQVVINALPFIGYLATNPSDYPAGIYNGFAIVMTMQRGFTSILFTINVTDLPSQ